MKLSRLQLYDFRNYKQLQLELDPGVNLILGENAQGKTNLLEAVSYLSTGRSFRTAKTQELIRFGADFADLTADVFSQGREQSVRAVLFAGRRPRQLYLGGVKQKSAAKLPGRSDDRSLLPRRSSGFKGRKPSHEEDSSIPRSASSGRAMQMRSQSIIACLTVKAAF